MAGNTFLGGNLTATGTLSVNGATTLASSLNGFIQATNGLVSATTSPSLNALSGTLGVANGGTGATSFPYGFLYSTGGTGALSASSSPVVGYVTATSTTATSTFAGGLNVAGANGLTVLQNGNVGIGTTIPTQTLDVAGKIALSGKQVLYLPDPAFTDSLIIGNGGTLLSATEVNPVDSLASENTGFYNGQENTFIGLNAGLANTTGNLNLFVGNSAGRNNINGDQNTFVGSEAGWNNTNGYKNAFIGVATGQDNTTGHNNVFVGTDDGLHNTTGSYNTYVGNETAGQGLTGNGNSFFGQRSGSSNTADNNTGIGYGTMTVNTSGVENASLGVNALYNNTTGSYNTAVGGYALNGNTTASYNVASGYHSLYNNTTGHNNLAAGPYSLVSNTTGGYNVSLGSQALNLNTTGGANTAVGALALYNNITGAGNVSIGYSAGAYETGSNAFYVDNQDRANTAGDKAGALLYGKFSATPSLQTLTINGKVGIGTISPGKDLEIANTSANAPAIRVRRSDGGSGSYVDFGWDDSLSGTAGIGLWSGVSGSRVAQAHFDSGGMSLGTYASVNNPPANGLIVSGNVGIGTTSPSNKLEVAGNTFIGGTLTATGTLTINTPNATSTITGNLYVNGALRSTTSYNGDLIFANNFRFTEAPLDGSPQGLLVQNQNNQTVLSIDQDGKLITTGDICSDTTNCLGSFNTSLASLSHEVDALASTTAIASSTASTLSTSTSFIQTIANAVLGLIQSTENWVVNQITAVTGIFTTKVQTPLVETNGIEMTSPNGQVWCVRAGNAGALQQTLGSCAIATSTSSSVVTVSPTINANVIDTTPIITPVSTTIITTTTTAISSPAIATSTDSVASTTPPTPDSTITPATSTPPTVIPPAPEPTPPIIGTSSNATPDSSNATTTDQ